MIKLRQVTKTIAGDLQTPVGLYLKIRDLNVQSALLESSDYHTVNNSFSFVCAEPIGSFKIENDKVYCIYPNSKEEVFDINKNVKATKLLEDYTEKYQFDCIEQNPKNGFFGYTAYDCVEHFESVNIAKREASRKDTPQMFYILYRFIIVVNHFKNELEIIENIPENQESKMDSFISILHNNNFAEYKFKSDNKINEEMSGDYFKSIVEKAIEHIKKGNIFQIVLSRAFNINFEGDDFNVYRALRRINPSPYLFYFDFGNFRIFGSSPETHLKISKDKAQIDPIAGTFKRTGFDEKDSQLASELLSDAKENSEHTMLVDLARNDLARSCDHVKVEFLKQIQYYSHLIHMVSRVSGTIKDKSKKFELLANSFPAGTLSGAPKVMAMTLIDELEQNRRYIYGGCIGFVGFNGDLNQAITIRTFLSKDNTLYFQAGAGIVADSNPEKELQEINNKLGALSLAIIKAKDFEK